ncbi:MAG: DUF2461 domain-containing protein, partial [Rhodothermaceae bacterium]|nr:DUF2461 domain-containing protein [Rhodothermaceae bacterium]
YEHDKLKRAPKGFDPNHPLIDDLRCKHFVGMCPLTEELACSDDFIPTLAGIYSSGAGYMEYLTRTLGHPW